MATQDDHVISLSEPVLGNEEKRALSAVIDSGWLTMGERVATFEDAFAKLHEVEKAVAVSSCTAGLHLSLAALGIGAGDEVLVPSLTFVATVNAVLYVGAKPVFVDIERDDLPHMSLDDARAKCTTRTKAVIIMHYAGYLMDIPAWQRLSTKRNLMLVEDAAHAPGVADVGRFSDAAVFSFFSNKNICTAEGGIVIARDETVLERIRGLRAHGMTTNTLDRNRGHAYSYDVQMLGYNYRMDELRAALGAVQLARLEVWNERRRDLSEIYRQRLAERLPSVVVPFDSAWRTAAHLLPVLLPEVVDRQAIMTHLKQHSIQSSIHYPPVHRFTYYQNQISCSLPRTDSFCARELTLPLHPSLNENDIDRVVKGLEDALSVVSGANAHASRQQNAVVGGQG
jgi:dTDP-4-amino-4,6-dideoxygalactose transaminase